MTLATNGILDELKGERERQQLKWGEQNLDPAIWLMIIGEEVGEANNAALEHLLGNKPDLADYRAELVQLAAVVVNAIESFDRQQKHGEKNLSNVTESPEI